MRVRRALKTGAILVAGVGVLGMTLGFVFERVAERREARRYPAVGRLVDSR